MTKQPIDADPLREELVRLRRENALLKEEVGRLNAVFHSALDCIFIKDINRKFVKVNRTTELLLGLPAGEIIGKRMDEVSDLQLHGQSEEEDQRVLAGEVVENIRHAHLKGTQRYFHMVKFPWLDEQGKVAGICGIVRDVTQVHQSQKELRAALEKFQTLFRMIPVAAFFTELDTGRYLEVSDSYEEFLGQPPKEVVGKTSLELGRWQSPAQRQAMVDELDEHGFIRARERSWLHADGSQRHGLWSAEVLDLDGTPTVLSVVMDITDRINDGQALRKSEARLRTLVDGSKDAIIALDQNRIITDCNPAFLAQFGYQREEALGQSARIIHPDEKSFYEFGDMIYPEVTHRGSWRGEWLYQGKAGEPFPMETVISKLQSPAGQEESYVAVMRDISERKQAELALLVSEHRFRELFDNMSSGVAVYEAVDEGRDFVFKDMNQAGLAMCSIEKEQLIGLPVRQVFPGVEKMGLFEVFQRVWRSGLPEKHPASFYQDGRITNWFENHVYKLPSGELVAIYEDITRRMQDEEALRWESLVNAALAGLAHSLIAQEADIQAVAHQVLDYAKGLTRSQYGYVASLDPETGDMVSYTLAELMETHCGLPPEMQTTSFQKNPDGIYPGLWGHALNTKRSFFTDDPAEHMASQGLPPGHVDVSNFLSVPVLFAGELVGQICLANAPDGFSKRDQRAVEQLAEVYALALHRIRGEEQQRHLETQLRQAQKMEALGTLAGGIAHDFNNILAAIMGYAELVTDDLPENHACQPDMANLMKAGRRAKNLVRQILGFSRQTEQALRPIKLAPLIKESLELLRATLPSTIAIQHDLGSGQGAVMADPTMVHQVVMNLCSNAAHAMSESGGLLKVTLEQALLDQTEAERFAELEPGAYQILSVTDNGKGMDQETLDRIFEPFFTTKEPGQGTGMGLAVVHGIVKSMQGAILLESAPGVGSSFSIYLPELSSAPETSVPPALDQMPRGKEKILFVDDEQALADLGARILGRLGYEVHSFSESDQAFNAFQEQPEFYDLVITDQTMPGITGLELAHAMGAVRPGLPIILCTGHSEQVSEFSNTSDMGISLFLFKPLSAASLAQAVRQVLDQSQ